MAMHDRQAPSKPQMQMMAQAALAALPAQFREQLGDIVLQVEDFVTPEQLASVGMEERWHLSCPNGRSGKADACRRESGCSANR